MTKFNTASINTNTLSLTDYSMINSKLAKVVIAFTGSHDKQSIQDALANKLQFLAAPIENSFRLVSANVAIGFIRANRPVRTIASENELRAGYKVMSSNILMDNSDDTLWEIKQGASGKYLARHGQEDLSSLVSASTISRNDVPGIHKISISAAAKNEFVAFASDSGDMDYGFCVASNMDKRILKVVSHATSQAVVIPYTQVASIMRVKTPLSAHKKIVEAGISREDKDQSIEYWTKLYSYAPSYLADLINQIETDATA